MSLRNSIKRHRRNNRGWRNRLKIAVNERLIAERIENGFRITVKKMKNLSLAVLAAIMFLASFIGSAGAATPVQTVNVDVVWTDTSNNELGFNIYQCVGQGCVPTAKIGQTAVNVVDYKDTIVNDPGSRVICYAVSAYNAAGESPKSNTACVTTPVIIVVPGAPSGVIATIVGVTVQ